MHSTKPMRAKTARATPREGSCAGEDLPPRPCEPHGPSAVRLRRHVRGPPQTTTMARTTSHANPTSSTSGGPASLRSGVKVAVSTTRLSKRSAILRPSLCRAHEAVDLSARHHVRHDKQDGCSERAARAVCW
ncbi:hypothetical protein B0H10DRAFT_543195 [Mycena sp. CBHHK59/15]|nr:hypothetical protein B0H10DRAFT_543195 [Mycena sp. CBHHK59/15]